MGSSFLQLGPQPSVKRKPYRSKKFQAFEKEAKLYLLLAPENILEYGCNCNLCKFLYVYKSIQRYWCVANNYFIPKQNTRSGECKYYCQKEKLNQ